MLRFWLTSVLALNLLFAICIGAVMMRRCGGAGCRTVGE
jgi:hypothetical protein